MAAERRQTCRLVWCSLLFIIVLVSPSLSLESDPTNRCPPQLPRTHYLKASEWGKCYEFHLEERTWRTANSICGTKGGHLVTIKEERIQRFLLQALSDYRWPRNGLWIGATDKEKEMDWLWITGERVKDGYSRWASGQPSCGFFCFEDCAVMRWKEGGRWHDYRCNWLEDYSFICEYDMLPEPTTPMTSSTASTTASTTTATITATTTIFSTTSVVPDNETSFILASPTKALESDYLLEAVKEKDMENNTSNIMLTPAVMLQGVNGARAEQVQESIATSSGMSSGVMAFIVITALTILVVGLCITLLFMRRRRKHIREDDIGVSYENPYYEETKAPLNNKKNYDTDTEGESDMHGDDVAVGKDDGAVGFTVTAATKKGTEMEPPPLFHARPKCVMNNYDTPPTLHTHLPVCTNKKGSAKNDNRAEYRPVAKRANQTQALPNLPKEMSGYYDEVRSSSDVNYDVPRASRTQHYESDSTDDLPVEEQMYYNNCDENIYESVDNLQAMVEQQGRTQNDALNAQNVNGNENQYVPFLFDGPKKVIKSE